MRLTQYRVSAIAAVGGLIQVNLLKVFYRDAKVVGHEIVLVDWCEPGQLETVTAQFMWELADRVTRGEWQSPSGGPGAASDTR